jgi:hypothetical protein
MLKSEKENINKTLEKNFKREDKAKFYFVKGLKAHQKTLVVKTKKRLDDERLNQVKGVLQKSLNDPLIDLLQWIDTVGGIILKKNLYKKPFFDSENIKEYNPWRVCPIGEHWVSHHLRQKETLEDVDGHCRKNPSGKDLIKGEEVVKVATSSKFKNVKTKTSDGIIDNAPRNNLFDELISGWTAFWNNVFLVDPPLDPDYVKALIATESMFNPNAENKKNSKRIGPARGLMQITEETQKILSGEKKELKDHFVILNDDEIKDPSKNISAGVRWLFRKRETAGKRLGRDPSWKEVLMEYKGKLNSRSDESQRISRDIDNYLIKIKSGRK